MKSLSKYFTENKKDFIFNISENFNITSIKDLIKSIKTDGAGGQSFFVSMDENNEIVYNSDLIELQESVLKQAHIHPLQIDESFDYVDLLQMSQIFTKMCKSAIAGTDYTKNDGVGDDNGNDGYRNDGYEKLPDKIDVSAGVGSMSAGTNKPQEIYQSGFITKSRLKEIADKIREDHKGYCALQLDSRSCESLYRLHSMLEVEDLAPKGIERDPHISVFYGIKNTVPMLDIQKIVSNAEYVLEIDRFEIFDTPKGDVLVMRPKENASLEAIRNIHAEIEHTVPTVSEFQDYKPHITVAFLKKGLGAKYIGKLSKYLPKNVVTRSLKVSTYTDDGSRFSMNFQR